MAVEIALLGEVTVWGADTPRRGRATLHSHISRLRGAFAGALVVAHRSDGYLPVREAEALNAVGWCAVRPGDFDTARDHCQAALTLHRHHHNPEGEATTLDSLAFIAHRTGDREQGRDDDAARVQRQLDDLALVP